MNTLHPTVLLIVLAALIVLSAFFSSSETGMMSLNRYRLRHLARKGSRRARWVSRLLERPDRLLGVILIGNTFANILASAIATILAVRYFGDVGVVVATIALTLVILIFAEAAPKTLAALHPEKIAFPASLPLRFLLKVFYPLVWLVNGASNGVLKLFRVRVHRRGVEPLTAEELRTLVNEATGKISSNYQEMLLRILDLEQVTVEDVMVPRGEVEGVDLDAEWPAILKVITQSEHEYMPLYHENINQVEGVLNLRKVLALMHASDKLNKKRLMRLAEKPYFVPEGALLSRQLINFQDQQRSLGLVVDEYGDIQGLITLQDILEEIVGEFSTGMKGAEQQIQTQSDGSVLVEGSMTIRDLNRFTQWELPTDGPKTLSGLIIEYLEMIPVSGIACRIAGYPMQVMQVEENTISQVQVWPELRNDPS